MKKLYIIPLLISMATLMLFNGCKKKTKDTATNVAVTQVTLNKDKLSLVIGTNETLVATITPENATNKNVSWSSGNTAVADVDNTGKVTAKATGTAIITITTADGAKTAICNLTVTAGSQTDFLANKNGNFTPDWSKYSTPSSLFTPWTVTTNLSFEGIGASGWKGDDNRGLIFFGDPGSDPDWNAVSFNLEISQTITIPNGKYDIVVSYIGRGITLKAENIGTDFTQVLTDNTSPLITETYEINVTTGTCKLSFSATEGWAYGEIKNVKFLNK